MSLPDPAITVWFGLDYDSGDFFTLDDTTKGLLDSADYTLAGDVGTVLGTLDDGPFYVSISRGRSRELDEFSAGTCRVSLRNFDRTFDPFSAVILTDDYDNEITDEDGNEIVVEGSLFSDVVLPGKRVTIEVHGQTIFDGTIEDWNIRYGVDGGAEAEFLAVDALGNLARSEFDAWTATSGQTAGPRITAVLNRSEVGFSFNRDIGTGISTLQGDNVSWGSNVLNYLQLVAKSDAGRLFASRTNVLTFRDRHSLVSATPAVVFADDGSGVGFQDASLEVGAELLFNRVGVDREGGTLQTFADTTSQGAYGVRTLNLSGLLMDSDVQSEGMAEWLLGLYKDPVQRVSEVAVNLSRLDDATAASVARVDIGDAVRVVWTPLGRYGQIDQMCAVEGVDHDMSYGGPHVMRFRLSPLAGQTVFILDDEVRGLLDNAALGY